MIFSQGCYGIYQAGNAVYNKKAKLSSNLLVPHVFTYFRFLCYVPISWQLLPN